nr:carboxylesterase family protein [Planctomycetota bacterium]
MRVAITAMCFMASVWTTEGAHMTIRDHAERDTRTVETNVYKQVGGQDLRLLVCKPDEWSADQARPAMVWIHGGGFAGGAPEAFLPHMKYSAARGAVAFGIQYRLMTSGGYKDDKKLSDEENQKRRAEKRKAFLEGASLGDLVADCEDAIRYIRAHADEFGVDR